MRKVLATAIGLMSLAIVSDAQPASAQNSNVRDHRGKGLKAPPGYVLVRPPRHPGPM
jgi:hypothetical protein